MVALLLEKRANVEHRAKTGLTPLMEAASGGYEAVGRLLLERGGAEVNASPVPQSKETALSIAAEKGHAKFVALLVEYGAHVEARNKKGCSPLWLACVHGHVEVAQLLVGVGAADPDASDSRRLTCLMAAFRKGHLKICKYLVKHVRHFPADNEYAKYLQMIPASSDAEKEVLRRAEQCMQVIVAAKERQAQEAARNASQLLRELDAEKSREESKRAAAARKREKRRNKKEAARNKQKKKQQQPNDDELAEKASKNSNNKNNNSNDNKNKGAAQQQQKQQQQQQQQVSGEEEGSEDEGEEEVSEDEEEEDELSEKEEKMKAAVTKTPPQLQQQPTPSVAVSAKVIIEIKAEPKQPVSNNYSKFH